MHVVDTGLQLMSDAGDDPRRMLFHFGPRGADQAVSLPPLLCLSGAIMVDCGSEPPAYLYASQARYPPYAALMGGRCLMWARDDAQVEALRERFAMLRRRFAVLEQHAGVRAPVVHEPLILVGRLDEQPLLGERGLEQAGVHLRAGVYCNQASPRLCALLEQLFARVGELPRARRAALRDTGRLALAIHDKTHCVELVGATSSTELPAHVPTVIFPEAELEQLDYAQLCARLGVRASTHPEVILKSSLDAAGEVSVSTDARGFDAARASLRAQIIEKIECSGRRASVQILAQIRIPTAARPTGPTTVGVTFRIDGLGRHELITVAGHLYATPERRHFVGTVLDEQLTASVLAVIGHARMSALLDVFARAGFRGPINIDVVRRVDGEPVFIYDYNPRMGGALPAAAVRGALRRGGHPARTLINPGYHGRARIPDPKAKLRALDEAGLLYTAARPRGVLPIPSFVHEQGWDWFFVDVELERARELWASGVLSAPGELNY